MSRSSLPSPLARVGRRAIPNDVELATVPILLVASYTLPIETHPVP